MERGESHIQVILQISALKLEHPLAKQDPGLSNCDLELDIDSNILTVNNPLNVLRTNPMFRP